VLPTAISCPSCRIVYSEIHSRVEERLLDKAADKIIEGLNEIAEGDSADLVCQKCHSILERPKERCSRCGFSASHIEQKAERLAEKREESLPVEPGPDAEDTEAVCPTCDSVVGLNDSVCSHCGAEFLPDDEGVEEDEAEPGPDAEGTEAVCPICDSVVGLNDSVCSHCGAEFLPDDEGVEEDDIQEDEQIYCPACYKEVGLETAKCPHCGAEFEEGEDLGPTLPADEIRFESVPESRALSERDIAKPKDEIAGITTSKSIRRDKGSIGLSNGTSAVNGVGIINGESRINGMHRTNGLGATNGRDMINGTGLARGESAGRIRAPIETRALAVLTVIIIVISAFVYVSYSQKGSPYEVDGDFDEWEDEVMFTMITASPSPATNVVEWAAATYSSQLHVYVKVEGQLMVGGSAQRLTFFVDADDRESTGYLLGDIGADFMLQILGWNETVMASTAYGFPSTQDRLDWNLWRQIGSVLSDLSGDRIEAMAHLPTQLNSSSRIILVSQDSEGIRCMSYPVLLGGGLLIVEQTPAPEIVATDIMTSSSQEEFLQLRFSCQGEGGSVYSVTPEMTGFDTCEPIAPFSLEIHHEHMDAVVVDSSRALPGQFASATLKPSGISSSFQRVLIIGEGGRAYCISPPETISIDGAFADWTNKTVKDVDDLPITNPNVNIDDFGVDRSTDNSYFYVSVFGEICSGVYVPKDCAVFTSAGGGAIVPTRKTAEDFARILIDSDQSDATGSLVAVGTLSIGADFMIEIGGVCGEIRSRSVYSYSSGSWSELDVPIQAAKDSSRIEIGVITSSIGDSAGMDFIIETTDWRGKADQATNTTDYGIRQWVVDSSTTDEDATSMSYQRKVFYDGVNFWSIYWDGSDTMCRYSSDGGETWADNGLKGGKIFDTAGVNEASLWYDSTYGKVYVIGDTSTISPIAYVINGTVTTGPTPQITWDTEETLTVSTSYNTASKNTFICMNATGTLWALSSSRVHNTNQQFHLKVFSSTISYNNSLWSDATNLLSSPSSSEEIRGVIVPAKMGSVEDVWVIVSNLGEVRKMAYDGSGWTQGTTVLYPEGESTDNTLYAPASAVVDGDGVLHVVYGTGDVYGSWQGHVMYTNYDGEDWSTAEELASGATYGNRFPTISLDAGTGNLFAMWIQNAATDVLQVKKRVETSWSSVTIDSNAYDKNYLTSIYSAPSESTVCMLWTQNTTADIEVIFEEIPEFKDVMVPILMIMAIFYIGMRRRRVRESRED
jgi:predicted amidophosphoribosyltransferase